MKILYFSTAFPSYSETFVQQEIKQLEDFGHEVVIVNLSGKNAQQNSTSFSIINNTKNPFLAFIHILKAMSLGQSRCLNLTSIKHIGLAVVERPSSIFKLIYLWLTLDFIANQIKGENFELSVFHFLFRSSLAGYLATRNLKIPFHLRLHTKSSVISKRTIKELLTEARFSTSISEDTASFYREKFNLSKEIPVVRQSIDIAGLQKVMQEKESAGFKIIAIGRLVEKKGFLYLIAALKMLSTDMRSKVRLSIYGNGPLKNVLNNQIVKLGLENTVSLQGVLSHNLLMTELTNADLLVVPSIETVEDIDGIPTVIPEAMVLRTPVIATDVAGIPELISEGKTGYLVPAQDSAALAEKIESVLNNPQLIMAVQEPAFKKVITEYKSSLASKLVDDLNKRKP